MESNIVFVGYGDLVIDHYYHNDKYMGFAGGGCVWNTLFYATKMGFESYAMARSGEDKWSQKVINDMSENGINIGFIQTFSKNTKNIFINIQDRNSWEPSVHMAPKCPKCGSNTWTTFPTKEITHENEIFNSYSKKIFIIDSLNANNRMIIQQKKEQSWIICFDLGWAGWFRYLQAYEIIEYLGLIDILHINTKFLKMVMNKLKLETVKELIQILDLSLLLVTDAANDIYATTKNSEWTERVDKIKVTDPTGGGDAFFAGALVEYLANYNDEFDNSLLQRIVNKGIVAANSVITSYGARAELNPPLDIDFACCCAPKPKKKENLNQVLNWDKQYLPKILSCIQSSCSIDIKNVLRAEDSILFAGFGASHSAAFFAHEIFQSNYNRKCNCCYLDEIKLYYINYDSIMIFSYSSFSNDVRATVNFLLRAGKQVIIITKAEKTSVEQIFDKSKQLKVLSYNNPKSIDNSPEKSFVSFASTMSPSICFYNACNKTPIIERDFSEIWSFWYQYFEKEISKYSFPDNCAIQVIYSNLAKAAAIDLEAKLIEGGVAKVILSSAKNFSHGRFNSLSSNDIVVLLSNCETPYIELLHETVNKTNPIITCSAKSDLDYLIAMQLLSIHIAKKADISLKKPQTNRNMLRLYNYKGEIF